MQDEEAVKLLLDAGARPAAAMGDSTPVHHCCSTGRANLLDLLLKTGKVDVSTWACQGWLPLALAARRGSAKCCRQLLAAGADAAALSQGKTALEIAQINNRAECVAVLEQAVASGSQGG